MDMKYWSLREYEPRPEQVKIIDDVVKAWDKGYQNVIIEAGTGVGKSAIATTLANMVNTSYICTMTNQLQGQYLDDFGYMLHEIKGKNNYTCLLTDKTCSDCLVDEVNDKNSNCNYSKIEVLNMQGNCDDAEALEFFELDDEEYQVRKCTYCPYRKAYYKARDGRTVITNYDYLWFAGNYTNQWRTRDLLILDETHNFEKKMMSLIQKTLNRATVKKNYGFDIFYPVTQGESLESIKTPSYWQGVADKIIDYLKANKRVISTKKRKYQMDNMKELKKNLENEDWVIDLPTKKDILSNARGLKAEFKPLMVNEYTDKLFHFGEKRLFLTGTLGSKQRFCHWNGLDQDSTYYIYVKSPFPVEHRPIKKTFVGNMSGFNNGKPNWQTPKAIDKIKEIIRHHAGEKGVIHTSSNQQAWWIKKSLNSKNIWVAQGESREDTIRRFESWNKPVVLVGAGIKDGVDFKGDKCRFQIIFKMPKPSIGSTQVVIRAKKDPTWYAYQTIMPTMQSYGRGIRDMDDWCTTYVLDSEFNTLLADYRELFNEYFLEAIE